MGSNRPRPRYVAFRVDGPRPFTRDEVMKALHAVADPLWLVEFEHPLGLVRCTNLDKDRVIHRLRALEAIAGERVQLVPLGTSGTIRRARRKYLGR